MARQETIKIDYPGSEISVNHYLGRRKDGGYYVKPETTVWKTEFQWLLKRLHLEDWRLPLLVKCSGYFKDERSAPDLSNLSKIIMDSIEELTGINDKDFRWHDGERLAGYKDPYLLITIKESEDKPEVSTSMPTKRKSNGIEEKGSGNLPKKKKGGQK